MVITYLSIFFQSKKISVISVLKNYDEIKKKRNYFFKKNQE